MATDRFAAFRPASGIAGDLFAGQDPDDLSHVSPAVPLPVGQENPQKSAMSHVSHVSHGQNNETNARFPLTAYMVALMRHPNIDQADPVAAASKYGLSLGICRTYLEDERRRRRAQK